MILALDPATHCGWAIVGASGVWDLSIRKDESGGMRLIRLRSKLSDIAQAYKIHLVVFEAQRGGLPGRLGALVVQAELQGVIKLWCEDRRIPYRGYSPTEVKKHATGKGNANKEAMLKAAQERWVNVKDDNEADALWLLDLATSEYGRRQLAAQGAG